MSRTGEGKPWDTSEATQILKHAIEVRRGDVYLHLTPAQYAMLKIGVGGVRTLEVDSCSGLPRAINMVLHST
jgi:hypothetical protein